MKNSSGALYIVAPLLILLIGVSALVYTSAQNTASSSFDKMSSMEIEAFNSQFTIYGGIQTGAKLKSMMGTLIANSFTYSEEVEKLPEVTAEIIEGEEKEAKRPEEANATEDYREKLAEIRNELENKHEYTVEFDYDDNGLLKEVIIKY